VGSIYLEVELFPISRYVCGDIGTIAPKYVKGKVAGTCGVASFQVLLVAFSIPCATLRVVMLGVVLIRGRTKVRFSRLAVAHIEDGYEFLSCSVRF